jgi:nicotinamidase-related amidase
MTITTLDANSALIIIDLQRGIVGLPVAHPISGVIEHAVTLLDAFRNAGKPVVLVNVTGAAPGRNEQPPRSMPAGADWADLIAQLKQQPSDLIVTKKTWGAFTNTDLDAMLKRLAVTQLVLAGVATSIGVESTARHAYELGYNIALATDAMTDMSLEAHQNSVERIFPRLGQRGTAAEIAALLVS